MSRWPAALPALPALACARPRRFLAALALAGLGACGGGGGGGAEAVVPPPDPGPSLRGLSCSSGDGTGWCWQRPQPFGVQVADVVFVDAQRGWAAGDAGRLLRTVDGGRSWTLQSSGADARLSTLAFADAQQGWAVSSQWPTLLRTADGGQTWTTGTPVPMQVSQSLQWLGGRTLLVSGREGYRLNVPTTALSEDGGSTWRLVGTAEQGAVNFAQSNGTLWTREQRSTDLGRSFARAPGWRADLQGQVIGGSGRTVWALASSSGALSAPGTAFVGLSSDSGQSFRWTPLELPPALGGLRLEQVGMYADGRGWARAQDPAQPTPVALVATSDFGQNWTRVAWPAGLVPDSLLRFQFVDGSTALLSNSQASWITRDGGASWAGADLPADAGVVVLARRDGGGGVLVKDEAGRWYRAPDVASTWLPVAQALPAVPAVTGLWFFDLQRGLALAADGSLFDSADTGRTWLRRTRLGEGLGQVAGGLQFRSGTGWLVDGDGRLRRSLDGGLTWATVGVGDPFLETTRSAHFIDALQGFATTLQCEGGLPAGCTHWLHFTVNGGGSWTRQPAPLGGAGSLVAFADRQRGVRMDDADGAMYFTTDGGRQWQAARVEGAAGGVPSRVVFTSDGQAWLLGNEGVRRSRDMGRSWQQVDAGLPPAFAPGITRVLPLDIAFADAQRGWIVATDGVVMRTDDGGATWQRQATTTQQHLQTLHVLDGRRAWIGGDRGVVLGTVSAGQ